MQLYVKHFIIKQQVRFFVVIIDGFHGKGVGPSQITICTYLKKMLS